MKILSLIRRVRSRSKDFDRRMRNPSVVSNGTKVREDETEVLAGSPEVPSCLPIDLGAAFRLRLRNALSEGGWGRRDGSEGTNMRYIGPSETEGVKRLLILLQPETRYIIQRNWNGAEHGFLCCSQNVAEYRRVQSGFSSFNAAIRQGR
jgi:hypothetical protein